LDLKSRIDKGFFSADGVWICYRRNYFQIKILFNLIEDGKDLSESINFPNSLDDIYVKLPDKGMCKILNFYVGIDSIITGSKDKVEIVQHTAKREKGEQKKPGIKLIFPGGDLSSYNYSLEQNTIVLYERLQFRKATCNNGKRTTFQQYYSIIINLYGMLVDGKKVRIGYIESSPLVVRGRSPGHY
ncbi:p53-like transcription factor, partial [Anaeromyces robustus]